MIMGKDLLMKQLTTNRFQTILLLRTSPEQHTKTMDIPVTASVRVWEECLKCLTCLARSTTATALNSRREGCKQVRR